MEFEDKEINNESDVEQKYLINLLTYDIPNGLGIPKDNIYTKKSIRSVSISKGSSEKKYVPDYIIVHNSVPLVVVEAKGPDRNPDTGFTEACMYARVINSKYDHNIDPIEKVIYTNFHETIFGYWNQEDPLGSFSSEEKHPTSQGFDNFTSFLHFDILKDKSTKVSSYIDKTSYELPRDMVGKSVAGRSVGYNQFGQHLTLKLKGYFNPSSRRERQRIVQKAYVKSDRRDGYVQPIQDVIQRARKLTNEGLRQVDSLEEPQELVDTLETVQNQAVQEGSSEILLLVGRAGCGKSTFIDYLREVALPNDLLDDTLWAHLNLEDMRITQDNAYDLVTEEITSILSAKSYEDLNKISNLKKMYAQEIEEFKKGPVSLIP